MRGTGDDRLQQKVGMARYDILRCWPFRADFALADAAKRVENWVTNAMGRLACGARMCRGNE